MRRKVKKAIFMHLKKSAKISYKYFTVKIMLLTWIRDLTLSKREVTKTYTPLQWRDRPVTEAWPSGERSRKR